jgi:septal ring factor EnvC (AmiA/AmiB activator)
MKETIEYQQLRLTALEKEIARLNELLENVDTAISKRKVYNSDYDRPLSELNINYNLTA